MPAAAEIGELFALANAGRFAEMETRSRLLIERYPDSGIICKALGRSLQRQGKDARDELRRASELLPLDAELHLNLGVALRAFGQLDQAVSAYRQALRIKPDYADAHNNLGNALRDLGQLDAAAASYRRSLQINSNFAEAHSNLGNVLKDLGRFDDAVASYRRALRSRPDLAGVHDNLGGALRDLGQYSAAVASHRRALQLAPDFADAHSNLGVALQALGQVDEAVAGFRRALELKPDFAEAHNNMGNALFDLGQLDAAAASYRRALQIKPNDADVHSNLGNALMHLGKMDEGEKFLSKALELSPGDANPLTAALSFIPYRPDDPRFEQLESVYARRGSLPADDRIKLNFAVGKAMESVGRHETAFGAYAEANRLHHQRHPFDEEEAVRHLDKSRGTFTSEWFQAFAALSEPSSQVRDTPIPIFIVGMPRSGTTLIEQMLASHPAVHGAGELAKLGELAGKAASLPLDSPGRQGTLTALRGLGQEYLEHVRQLAPDAPYITDKMPGNYRCLWLIHLMLPNAKIIHALRDPMDTCFSCYALRFAIGHEYSYELGTLGRQYLRYRKLMTHWRDVLPPGRMLDVHYESIVAHPEREARLILEYLGLPWNSACLEFHKTERAIRTASVIQVRKPIYSSSVTRWRHFEKYLAPLFATIRRGVGTVTAVEMSELAALVNAGRYAELESDAREIIGRHPGSGFVWKVLGIALSMQRKDALHALTRAATLLPDDAEAHGNLANALQSLGRLDDAVTSYRRALALNPSYTAACNNLGNALRGLGLLDEAVASYRRALELEPGFIEAHSNLGNALRNLGQLDQAVASYRRALAIKPHYPEACNNLGNALLDLGQLDEAQASYARAVQIKPDFAEAHSNLGNALRRLGQLDQAVASYRRALALHPDFAGAHSNLGDTLRDLGQPDAAVASCRRAVELAPDLSGAHNSLGNALLDLGRLDEAVASYRRALALNRAFVEAYVNLGLVLRQLGRVEEAEATCRTALEFKPSAAQAIVVLAELRADGGHFAEAEELFKRAVALNPESSEGWAGIAYLRKMTVDDATWAAQAQRIAERRPPPREEAHLRFALGKYFDDVKQFAEAFVNYRRANELMKMHGAKHDRRQLTAAVDLIIHSSHDRLSETGSNAGASSARPVFIVGMPRSGTSLAEQILASHPAIFGAGELTFWNLASAEMHKSAALAGEMGGNIIGKLADDYVRLLEHLSADALRVVDKMPGNFLSLGLIHAALPNARIIHMRRNPIDTCLSVYFQHFRTAHAYANDLEDLAHYYREYLRVMRHWRSVLPASAMLEVRYEALVDDQDAWSRNMVEFIGLPWDPRCIDFHRTDRRVSTASKWQVRQAMSKSSIDRWRNYEKFATPLLDLMEP